MMRILLASLALSCAFTAASARADEKADPSGTWKWTSGLKRQPVILRIHAEGDRWAGTMIGRDGKELTVEDAKFQNGELSFKTVGTTPEGDTITIAFHGKLAGDTIKGKANITHGGETHTGNWEAKRAKD